MATTLVAMRKATSAGGGIGQLIAKAHEMGLDAAAARLFAKTLPQAAATEFLQGWTEHKKETP
jgi:hypothetical protein